MPTIVPSTIDSNLDAINANSVSTFYTKGNYGSLNKQLTDLISSCRDIVARLAEDETTISGKNPTITTTSNKLSGDVTMTNANTYYDGPSVSLTAGTWLINSTVSVASAANLGQRVTAKLWDGTTVTTSSEEVSPALGLLIQGIVSIGLSGIVTPSITTTYKISCASDAAGCTILAAAIDNGAGNNASSLYAIKIA